MRLIKILSSAAVAAIAAMALIGTSSAVAEIHEGLGLCLKNELLLCAIPLAPPAGGSILLLLKAKSPKFVASNGFELVCENSKISANIPGAQFDKNPIAGTINEFSFTGNCKTCTTVTMEGLPYSSSWSMLTSGGESSQLKTSLKEKLTGCPLGVSCTFTSESVLFKADDNASGLLLKAEGVSLKLTSGSKALCGETASWTAEYNEPVCHLLDKVGVIVETHQPCWLTLLKKV